MFSYATVERILAELHAQPPSRLAAFRGRLKYLRKLGVPLEEGPGKGTRFQYSREHLYQMALALELAQLGIGPDISAAMAKCQWPKLHKHFRRAEKHEGPFFLEVLPEFISWNSAPDVEATYRLRLCTRDEAIQALDDTADKVRRRRSFINLTALLERIALEAAKGESEEEPEGGEAAEGLRKSA